MPRNRKKNMTNNSTYKLCFWKHMFHRRMLFFTMMKENLIKKQLQATELKLLHIRKEPPSNGQKSCGSCFASILSLSGNRRTSILACPVACTTHMMTHCEAMPLRLTLTETSKPHRRAARLWHQQIRKLLSSPPVCSKSLSTRVTCSLDYRRSTAVSNVQSTTIPRAVWPGGSLFLQRKEHNWNYFVGSSMWIITLVLFPSEQLVCRFGGGGNENVPTVAPHQSFFFR